MRKKQTVRVRRGYNKRSMKPRVTVEDLRGQLLTTQEAAEILGIGPNGVRDRANRGLLPYVRTAKGTRIFLRSDVEAERARRMTGK